MTASEYVLTKQIHWANINGITLIGSKGARGRLAYTASLDENLFEPLDADVRKSFIDGDGSEIVGTKDSPAKMQAVHSSSALGVNIFYYWKRIDQIPQIAAACGFCQKGNNISLDIKFEEKYPIDNKLFRFPPNIDVVILNADLSQIKCFAIECKFSEAYTSRGHQGLKKKYLDLSNTWSDIPEMYSLAKSISPYDNEFVYLHSAQLIKHILGLKKEFRKGGFKLLYLWYDVLGEAGATHRKEIERFSKVAKADNIKFHALSYQELIAKLSKDYWSTHRQYIDYISSRYL